ncbi:MAG: RIP metalloprotease RseP [Thermodesulfobacteriota bacterium]
MNSVISFVIVLGVLIFVHEFGHFLFAKLFRVKVLKFSLGFGPKVVGVRWGETEYLLSAVPLGGYVKMLGENPGEEVEETDQDRSFSSRPVWQRFLIVLGGPSFNLLFAVVLFFLMFAAVGLPVPAPGTVIGSVNPDSPAARAGLEAGDEILAIDGKATREWEEVSSLIKEGGGKPVTLSIRRGGETLEVTGTPEEQEIKTVFGEPSGRKLYLLGISRSEEVVYEETTIGGAFAAGLSQTWAYIYLTIMGIVKMIQKVIPASELGGPILIAQLAGKQLQSGLLNFFSFMGLVSVNLGILNLFPIPILDGGHLVFFSVEALRRRPLSQRTQEIMQQIGLVILASLMLFVFYNDLVRLFAKS